MAQHRQHCRHRILIGFDQFGKVFAKPSFPAAAPQHGDARFRASNDPLGTTWDSIYFLHAPQFDVRLAEGRAVWLRLIPTSPLKEEFGPLDLKNAALRGNICLLPLVDNDLEYLIAEDGFGICDASDHSKGHTTRGVAFAFVTGEVWSIDTHLLNFPNSNVIYFGEIAGRLIRRFRDYTIFLGNLGINPPFHWLAGLEGVLKMTLSIPPLSGWSPPTGPTCMSNTVADGGLYDGTEDAAVALAPFFDKLFKKCGSQRPAHLRDLTAANLR